MQPGDRSVMAFVHDQQIGTQFTEWPLHVTIVSWARGNITTQTMAAALERALREISAFTAVVGGETRFVNGTILVNEIAKPTAFEQVFKVVKAVENDLGLDFVSTVHPIYRPHVTVQRTERLQERDNFAVRKLYIVEQKGDYKEIVAEVSIGG